MSKDLLVLADEYAAAAATFARALALKDEADSMSPIAREAGDKRAVLAEALAALDTAQPEPVNAMLVEALERMVESVTGVDQVSAVNEARAALTAAKQAQPSQADAQDAARYRWLAGHCRSTSEHWGGRWSIIVEGPAPKSHGSEDGFDAAIDAARKQGGQQ